MHILVELVELYRGFFLILASLLLKKYTNQQIQFQGENFDFDTSVFIFSVKKEIVRDLIVFPNPQIF